MSSSRENSNASIDDLLDAASRSVLGHVPENSEIGTGINPYVDDLSEEPTGPIPIGEAPLTGDARPDDSDDEPTVPIPIVKTDEAGQKPDEASSKSDPRENAGPFRDERSKLRRLTDLGRLPTLVTTSILSRISARRWNRPVTNREAYIEQLNDRQRRMLRVLDTLPGAIVVGGLIIKSVPPLAHALDWAGDAIQTAAGQAVDIRNDWIGLDGKPGPGGPAPDTEPAASPGATPTPSASPEQAAPAPTNEPELIGPPKPEEDKQPPAAPDHIAYKAEPGDGSLRVSKEALVEYAKEQGIDPDQIERSHVKAVQSAFVNDEENDGKFYGGGRMNLGETYEFNDAQAKVHSIVDDIKAGGDGFPEKSHPVNATDGQAGFGAVEHTDGPTSAQNVSNNNNTIPTVNVEPGDTWDNLPPTDVRSHQPLPQNVSEAILRRFTEMLEEEANNKPVARV